MGIDELRHDAAAVSHWAQHRFLALVIGAILISLFLVSVAMSIYNSSGAAQLDLSRPGYVAVRKAAGNGDSVVNYPSNGTLDKAALDKFKKLYTERMIRVMSTSGYEDSAMSDDSLQLTTPAPVQ